MRKPTKLDKELTVGPQPGREYVAELRRQGFATVIDLRGSDEDDQRLAPVAEDQVAREQGLHYLQLTVPEQELRPELVDLFRLELARLPPPAFVHSKTGTRAAALGLMAKAVERRMSGPRALSVADRLGLGLTAPELRAFIEAYVSKRAELTGT